MIVKFFFNSCIVSSIFNVDNGSRAEHGSSIKITSGSIAIVLAMHNLKEDYTIVIVTHNMQQALRVSDFTAFFNAEEIANSSGGKVGYLVEFDNTEKIFNSPSEKATLDYISGKFG